MKRACQVTVEILQGKDILDRGFELSRQLFNYTRHLDKVRRAEKGEDGKPTVKYPGAFGYQKQLQSHWAYQGLSDRCSSYTIKDFDIAYKSYLSNWKSNPDAHPPGYCENGRTLTFEVGRNAKPVGEFEYRLTVLGAATTNRHAVVKIHLRPGIKMRDIKLIRVKSKMQHGWYAASLILALPDVAPVTGGLAALDLGVINLGALAFNNGETILYNGRGLLSVMQYADKRAAQCKPSNWKPGKRVRKGQDSPHKKAYLNKAYHTSDLAIHNFTTSVIRECQARGIAILAVGKLTGIRENKDFGKAGNQKFHRWPHLKIRDQLRYKGEEVGIKVIEISEAYTSQTCSRCGTIRKANRVERGLYACSDCGMVINADVNGALNMLNKVSSETKVEDVEAGFPGLPSTGAARQTVSDRPCVRESAKHSCENHPVFTAEFDFRNWSIVMTRRIGVQRRCNATGSG